jgi:hypothetical protein
MKGKFKLLIMLSWIPKNVNTNSKHVIEKQSKLHEFLNFF